MRITLKDIVMYLSHLVSALKSTEKLTRKEASAIDCKITDLARSLATLTKKKPESHAFSDQGLAELAKVYELHPKWPGAMRFWIASQ